MSGLLSWKLNQGDPRAGFAAAGTRWSALVGIGDNTVAGLLDGRKINPMIPFGPVRGLRADHRLARPSS